MNKLPRLSLTVTISLFITFYLLYSKLAGKNIKHFEKTKEAKYVSLLSFIYQ